MNYGAIGSIIGHEITHGFDDQGIIRTTFIHISKVNSYYCLFQLKGRQTNKEGNAADWWVGSTKAKYLTLTQCFIEQYGNYTTPNGTNVSKSSYEDRYALHFLKIIYSN